MIRRGLVSVAALRHGRHRPALEDFFYIDVSWASPFLPWKTSPTATFSVGVRGDWMWFRGLSGELFAAGKQCLLRLGLGFRQRFASTPFPGGGEALCGGPRLIRGGIGLFVLVVFDLACAWSNFEMT